MEHTYKKEYNWTHNSKQIINLNLIYDLTHMYQRENTRRKNTKIERKERKKVYKRKKEKLSHIHII